MINPYLKIVDSLLEVSIKEHKTLCKKFNKLKIPLFEFNDEWYKHLNSTNGASSTLKTLSQKVTRLANELSIIEEEIQLLKTAKKQFMSIDGSTDEVSEGVDIEELFRRRKEQDQKEPNFFPNYFKPLD